MSFLSDFTVSGVGWSRPGLPAFIIDTLIGKESVHALC